MKTVASALNHPAEVPVQTLRETGGWRMIVQGCCLFCGSARRTCLPRAPRIVLVMRIDLLCPRDVRVTVSSSVTW
jgi:hypothetical protein